MNDVRNYQILKISGNKNFKRIINEIKKIDYITSASIENNKYVLHLEYSTDVIKNEEDIKKLEEDVTKAIREYEKKAQIIKVETIEKYRKVLYLNGLDCAHCAMRVETTAKRTINHEQIIVDFPTGRFIIETYDPSVLETLVADVTKIAKTVDDRITVAEVEQTKRRDFDNAKKMKPSQTILFILGIILTIIFYIINHKYANFPKILYVIPYLMIGYPVVWRFLKNLFKGQLLDETFLMTIASIGAFPTGHEVEAIVVVLLYQIGEILQNRAVNHSRKSILNLLNFEVKTAKIKLDLEITEVNVESLLPGDIMIVSKGEMVPADGVIVSGKTNIDTKNLTGESLLRSVDVGETILSGSINMGQMIEVKVLRPYRDSMISKIMDLVENAASNKGKTETFISQFARYFTPFIVLFALIIATCGIILDSANWKEWIYTAMELLVISCPCALVISVPLCYFSTIGVASRQGILVKGSNYIEALSNVENMVFDKTGTLTKGLFSISKVVPVAPDITEEALLNLVIYAEYYSTHPIGISVVDAYGRENIFSEIISDFTAVTGGSKATINGNKILVGNYKLMHANKIEIPDVETSNLVIHVVKNKIYQGYVEIGDIIKEEAKETIEKLHKQKIEKCYMLTGDSRAIAENVAKEIGIDETHSELLPHQKVEFVEKLKKNSKGKTVFIGDGINDAPVIASADVGIAMGEAGSDATIAIADIVIMGDNLTKLNDLITLSKKSKRKVLQNIIFCLSIKAIVMLAAIVLAAFNRVMNTTYEFPLFIAIFADVGVSLIAILNSLLLLRSKKSKEMFNKKGEIKNE